MGLGGWRAGAIERGVGVGVGAGVDVDADVRRSGIQPRFSVSPGLFN